MVSAVAERTVLLTSFAVWRTHQRSNSSDDLLLALVHRYQSPLLHVFRQLPVNVPVAQALTIAKIQQLQPQVVLCCGMAEARDRLNLEARAVVGDRVLQTSMNLNRLTKNLKNTEISRDAGRFVCNGLYYAILNYLQSYHPSIQCLFVHVPVLTIHNQADIVADFSLILERVLTV